MNYSTAQRMNGTNATSPPAQLEITETDIKSAVEESQKMREHIGVQATAVGPILEALLRDVHDQTHWGLNE